MVRTMPYRTPTVRGLEKQGRPRGLYSRGTVPHVPCWTTMQLAGHEAGHINQKMVEPIV